MTRRRLSLSAAAAPMLAAIAGVAVLALMDAFMKGAALATGAYSAAVFRSLVGASIALPIWLARGATWPGPDVLRLHLLRGGVSAIMALSFFYSLTKLPIAEAIAISFMAPLLALYLAHLFLGEVIRRAAIAGSVLGLIGTIVIVGGKIGSQQVDRDLLLGLAAISFSTMLYAANFVIMRKQSQVALPLEVATFHSGVGGAVLLLAAPWFLVLPAPDVLVDIACAGALTVAGAILLAWTFARAEAQTLVPLEYTGFLWAALFGWLFFAERVTPATSAGTVLIVIGCWLATRPVADSAAGPGSSPPIP
ncbi:DMT family transporter [Alteripontixanthobacter maritimus]|nr:DMT family transporter [Alteripontixanthobacter maritimus]